MKIDKRLGQYLKSRRQALCFDFNDVAKMLACNSAHLLAIENGEKTITASMLHKLALVLEISKKDLSAFDEIKQFKGTVQHR